MIRGYAALFNVLSRPGNRPEPMIVKPGAYDLFGASIFLQFGHDAPVYATTREGNLRVWQDDRGLAFEADPTSAETSNAIGLLAGIGRRSYDQCSVGYRDDRESRMQAIDGEQVEIITRTQINEISIAVEGGCPGTAAWLAHAAPEDLPPLAASLAPHWAVGRMAAMVEGRRYPLFSREPF